MAGLSHRRQAAVARDDRAGRVRGRVAREEQRDLRDVVGVPSRFARDRSRMSMRRNSSGSSSASVTLRNRGVSIDPGAITLARTVGPYSTAIWRVSAMSPAFAAPYAA